MIKVILVDDHQIIRHGLKMALEADKGITVIGEYSTSDDAIEAIPALKPDVAVVDVSATGNSGMTAIRQIAAFGEKPKVLVLTLHQSAHLIRRLKDVGVMGVLTKDAAPQDFADAARCVAKGEFYLQTEVAAQAFRELLGEAPTRPHLSTREIDVVRLVSQGYDTENLSGMLSITPRTAQTHLYHAMKKLDLHTRQELIQYAVNEGLIPDPDISL